MGKKISEWLASVIIRGRSYYLVLFLIVSGLFLFHAKDIKLGHSLRGNAPENHRYVKLNDMMVDTFGLGNMVIIAVEVKNGTIFNPNTLDKILKINEKVEALRGVFPYLTISIACKSLRRVYVSSDPDGTTVLAPRRLELVVKDIIDNNFDNKLIEDYAHWIKKNKLIYGRLVSEDMKGTVIMVPFRWLQDYRYIFSHIKKLAEEMEDENTEIIYAGRPITLGYIQSYLWNILLIFAVAVVIAAAMLFVFFRMLRGVILPLSAGLLTVGWTLGFAVMTGHKLDVMNVTIPFLVLAVALSHSVQVMRQYIENINEGQDQKAASQQTISKLLNPCTAAIITDLIGFSLLYFLPFGLLKSLVLVSRAGIVSIFFTVLFFIPVTLSFLPKPPESSLQRYTQRDFLSKILTRIGPAVSLWKGRLALSFGFFVLLIFAAVGVAKVEIGDTSSGTSEFWENSTANRMLQTINEKYTGTDVLGIYVHPPLVKGEQAYGGLWDPKIFSDMNGLQRYLEKECSDTVRFTVSLVDVCKGIKMAFYAGDPKYYDLPETEGEACNFMDVMIGGGPPESTRSFVTLDQSQAAIRVFLKDHKPATIRSIIGKIDTFIKTRQVSKAIFDYPGDTIGIYASIMEEIGKSQIISIVQILIVIFSIVSLSFRSFKSGFVLIVPLLFSTLVTYAILGFANIGLFVATLPIASIGMGVGIDYGIYVLARFKDEISKGKATMDALCISLTTAGRSVCYTALSLTVGVAVLCVSPLRFQAVMGVMLTIVFISCMLFTLLLLPMLLTFRPFQTNHS